MASSPGVAQEFGANVLRARRRVCLSQEETAVRACLHRTEIGLLERGERTARLDTFVKLLGALEADPRDLLRGIEWLPGPPHPGCFWVRSDTARRP